jgi:hypothetical protein
MGPTLPFERVFAYPRVMARPYVSLTDPPGGGQLEGWGLDVGGEWWALVVWSEWVNLPGGDDRASPAQLRRVGPRPLRTADR